MVEAAADLYCKPLVAFNVQRWQVSGKLVLEIIVQKSKICPHLAPDKKGKHAAYIRVKYENFIACPIQVKVWEKMASEHAKPFVYSQKYELVLEALRKHKRLTLPRLSKQILGSEKEVEEIPVELVLAKLVSIEVAGIDACFLIPNNR